MHDNSEVTEMSRNGRFCGQGPSCPYNVNGATCAKGGGLGGRDWAGTLSLLCTHLHKVGGGRRNRGVQRGWPHEWGNLCEGGCEHVGVPEMVGAAHLWNPLSVWKGWGAQMGRAHANGGASEVGQ